MKKIYTIIPAVMLLILFGAASASSQVKDEPGTLIKAAKFLEEKPFDKDAKNIRSWAIIWVTQTDKVGVTVCSLLLSGLNDKYKYNPEILAQYTIGMAAFKLSNPDRTKDEDAAQVAGMKSALIAYQAMVKEQPKAKNPFLDDLVTKRVGDSWANYVAEHNCKGKK
ncbi:MAG TPA: hypothetical protein DC054_00695 [Blastocatellia bacterium]|nr:hypothetical protein [Blastocatellia bacterium]